MSAVLTEQRAARPAAQMALRYVRHGEREITIAVPVGSVRRVAFTQSE